MSCCHLTLHRKRNHSSGDTFTLQLRAKNKRIEMRLKEYRVGFGGSGGETGWGQWMELNWWRTGHAPLLYCGRQRVLAQWASAEGRKWRWTALTLPLGHRYYVWEVEVLSVLLSSPPPVSLGVECSDGFETDSLAIK